MAISSGGGGNDTPMSDINTTPLVDVMLVLLIVFLIAIKILSANNFFVIDIHIDLFIR
jgi:biopolymer transport protein ExbD